MRGDQRLTRYRFLNGTKNEGRKQRNLFSGLRSLIECCECGDPSERSKGRPEKYKAARPLTAPISARGQIGLSFVGFVCDGRRGRTRRIRQSIVWGERPNVLLLNSHIAGEIAVAGIKPGPITHQAHEAIPVRSG